MARHEIVASFWEEPVGPPVGYVRHRRGAVVDVPDEHVERLLRIGAIAPVEQEAADDEDGDDAAGDEAPESGDDGTPVVTGAEADTAAPAEGSASPQPDSPIAVAEVERPKQTAAKPIWVEYAVARGMNRDDAEALDKRELIAELD
ncbi:MULTISPECIES: hypothetical protein [Rhodococcus]|uniref:hypothetical protein n=1 Tax=Rhodococcus TaxID=1827 RepID=UPI002952ADD7|nr:MULTISPECIES: hypothetical protein [Rhodococcus]MDV7244485.1 hypothetical protein [Rhodococcus oxybenzonivorans]MDV7274272.1 hypothetical protein [Rhodococcus oxybenzonivorans]MDV7337842.1 hypothetical protein [Rhodococcus oxybenzonivorans]MDV7345222.1 hypothetical protein [Rhodococcus oxybenzonivorans]MDV8028910.1 hypothetical protein [Rhodococcus sp. IEGM 27]